MKVCPVCGTEYGEEAAFCSRDRSPLRPVAGTESQGLVGQLVGERYQVERRLGEGGMGEVYLARHVLIGRPCALKVMSQSLSKDPDAVSRFNREATNASSISHPNVCAVYDFGLTSEGLVYLAMEYIEGRTLNELLEATGPMPVRRAAALLTQCAAGLTAAHELGIVHRDLKPDNIMVLSAKDRESAKLVDFGIAKAVEGTAGQRVTKTGFVVGTPEYMSPEQLSGDPVDGRSDQYSLALVFYRLITGQLPFEGNSLQETLVKRLTDPPRPLAISRPDAVFPAGLQAIMDRALARYSDERYPSVIEFSDAVNAVVQADEQPTRKIAAARSGGEIPPTRQSPAPRPGRGSRLAGAAVGVLLAAGAAWAIFRVRPASQDTTTNAAPAPPPAVVTPLGSQRSAPLGSKPAPSPPPSARLTATAPDSHPGSVPIAPPPPPPIATAPADTAELDLNALESPALRVLEIRRAFRVLRSRQPPHRRAAAAFFLGTVVGQENKRDSALALFQLAYRLDARPIYLRAIRQFGDTIQP